MQMIAERLGLSVATVSRSLRRVAGINAETRAKVLEIASELDYKLPAKYGNVTIGKNHLRHIGIFIKASHSNLAHPYITGLSEAAMTLNCSLIIHHVKPEECESVLDPKRQPRAMASGLLSGIVLIFDWPENVVAALSQIMPVVAIMYRYPKANIDMIGIENKEGMEVLVDALCDQGHRQIAFIGRCPAFHWSTSRFGGYVTALASHDLEYNSNWVVDVDPETLSRRYADWTHYNQKIAQLVSQRVTALACATEAAGWAAHRWLVHQGIRVPEEVSVTGFHRPARPEPSLPNLTSVNTSYEAMGAAALKRLHLRIQDPSESSRSILFPCVFYPGATIGPPRSCFQGTSSGLALIASGGLSGPGRLRANP